MAGAQSQLMALFQMSPFWDQLSPNLEHFLLAFSSLPLVCFLPVAAFYFFLFSEINLKFLEISKVFNVFKNFPL